MGVDYAEKEREFINGLKADTGRDLAGWMAAIAAQNIKERNALIDWLRLQGFTFARASWMERIHHNGGRLIYADDAPAAHVEPLPPVPPVQPVAAPGQIPVTHERPTLRIVAGGPLEPPPAAPMAPPPPASDRSELEPLFEQAKAYRALARHVTAEIEKLVPGSRLAADAAVITFAAPDPYAALVVSPKGLRLYLDAGSEADGALKKADSSGAKLRPQPYGHVAVLTDARAIDAGLKRAIVASAARARS